MEFNFGNLLFMAVLLCMGDAKIRIPLRYKRASANNLKGTTVTGYYITVNLGTPPQTFNVIVDTGSSNFAVSGTKTSFSDSFYNKALSNTSIDTTLPTVDVHYTEGWWKGNIVSDLLTIPSANLIQPVRVHVADISETKNFFINESQWIGILGLAYSSLVLPKNGGLWSVMHDIVEQTTLEDILSMQLCSTPTRDETQGVLLFGEWDSSLATGQIYWTRIVKQWYYDILITGLKVGDTMIEVDCEELNNDRTIVDSGTTNLRLPQKVYNLVVSVIKTKLVKDDFDDDFYDGTKMFCTSEPNVLFSWFPNLSIFLPSTEANKTIELTVFPQSYLQLTEGLVTETLLGRSCYKFAIFPSTSGSVLGTVVMEQYYVVFDRGNNTVGFATSKCAVLPTTSIQIRNGWINSTSCQYISHSVKSPLTLAAYIVLGLFCICLLPVCFLIAYNFFRKRSPGIGCCSGSYNQLNDT
uniref:Beta-secretase 1-like n=1 Tax=Ciona intestinalis TaxID=7719 RepID=F6TSI9_CIOIN|nr:beta-secretase 1-like [Ciona intestinalis]|eukprot:XP_018671056.1 beta-secretase 1-like [Ciona intestinalis]